MMCEWILSVERLWVFFFFEWLLVNSPHSLVPSVIYTDSQYITWTSRLTEVIQQLFCADIPQRMDSNDSGDL